MTTIIPAKRDEIFGVLANSLDILAMAIEDEEGQSQCDTTQEEIVIIQGPDRNDDHPQHACDTDHARGDKDEQKDRDRNCKEAGIIRE